MPIVENFRLARADRAPNGGRPEKGGNDMNKKKMALVHSVIALLLCCSMLIGTTFAWFTDSVSSVNNIIKYSVSNVLTFCIV